MGASRKEKRSGPGGLVAVRRGALGDTLLFLPVLEAFRRAFPGEETLFVGNGDYLELVSLAGLAEKTASASTWPPLLDLHRRRGISGPPPPELARAFRVLLEWEEDREWGRVRLFRPGPEKGVRKPLTLQVLSRLGLEESAPWPPPPLETLKKALAAKAGEGGREGKPLAVLHPGAGSPGKAWPAGRFAGLGRLLEERGWEVRVLLGPVEEERGPGPALFREEGLSVEVLREVLDLGRRLAGASLYVGNDSGPSHLAAALGVPSLVLFGPTDPLVWGPPWPGAVCLAGEPSLGSLEVERVLEEACRVTGTGEGGAAAT
ncbi:MAG TPA: hypothetical protein ENJ97_04825 [Planctomycetes bacterium]|nr:hypothetical protein [Planctomycetota bacterium]